MPPRLRRRPKPAGGPNEGRGGGGPGPPPRAAGAPHPASVPRAAEPPGREKRGATWRRRGPVLLFLPPWIVGFSVFFGYPLVMSGSLSFSPSALLNPPRYVGL